MDRYRGLFPRKGRRSPSGIRRPELHEASARLSADRTTHRTLFQLHGCKFSRLTRAWKRNPVASMGDGLAPEAPTRLRAIQEAGVGGFLNCRRAPFSALATVRGFWLVLEPRSTLFLCTNPIERSTMRITHGLDCRNFKACPDRKHHPFDGCVHVAAHAGLGSYLSGAPWCPECDGHPERPVPSSRTLNPAVASECSPGSCRGLSS